MGQRRTLSSVSVSKFSYTPENLLAFNRTVSCKNSHQQQPGVDNITDHKTPLLSAGKAPLARSIALTFPSPLISQKGKLRQTQATCSGFHCTSVLEPGEELTHSAVNFSVLFLPQLEGMFTPHSLSSRLTGSLRIFPGLPAPIPPFPPSSQYIFSQSFPLASPVVLESCQTPATLWEAGPPIPKPNKWEKGNKKKKKKSQYT